MLKERLENSYQNLKKIFKKLQIKNKTAKRILHILKEAMYYLFFFFLLIVTATNFMGRLNGERPEIFGYSTLMVVSGSMEPTYHIKEFLVMKNVNFDSIVKGDVVTFTYDIDEDGIEDLVTHRVIEVKDNGDLVVRGDNLELTEYQTQIVNEDNYIGKIVFHSYIIGLIVYALVEYNVLLIIISAFFVYLIIKQILKIINVYQKKEA